MHSLFQNFTNLKYFCDAARLGSISQAAKANHVTQSAVSQGIKKLEEALSTTLIAHHPKCFRLTPSGKTLLALGQDLLKRTMELQLALQEDQLGDLEFACTHSFSCAIIPRHLKQFITQYPKVKINFHVAKNEQVKTLVREGSVDFGILTDEDDLESFEKRKLHEGYLRLFAAQDVPKKNVKNLGFILSQRGHKERILLADAYYKKFGKEISGICEVGSWNAMAQLVAEGIGMAYFPEYLIEPQRELFQQVDLGLECHSYTFVAISSKGMQLRKSSRLFLDTFGSNF